MSREEGYTRFCCDRAEKVHKGGKKPEAYLLPTDKARGNWHEVTWVDLEGIEMHSVLCESCYLVWEDMQKSQRYDNQKFMYDLMK